MSRRRRRSQYSTVKPTAGHGVALTKMFKGIMTQRERAMLWRIGQARRAAKTAEQMNR